MGLCGSPPRSTNSIQRTWDDIRCSKDQKKTCSMRTNVAELRTVNCEHNGRSAEYDRRERAFSTTDWSIDPTDPTRSHPVRALPFLQMTQVHEHWQIDYGDLQPSDQRAGVQQGGTLFTGGVSVANGACWAFSCDLTLLERYQPRIRSGSRETARTSRRARHATLRGATRITIMNTRTGNQAPLGARRTCEQGSSYPPSRLRLTCGVARCRENSTEGVQRFLF
jgi:hypothetical protein